MIQQNLNDILSHTHDLGMFELVKVTVADGAANIQTTTEDKSVILYGNMNNNMGLDDAEFGLHQLGVLAGYSKFGAFATDGEVKVTTELRSGVETPSGLKFDSNAGHTASYRFLSPTVLEAQLQVPQFKGAEWDVEYSPTMKDLDGMLYFSNILGAYHNTFTVKIEDDILYVCIGNGSDGSQVPMGKVISKKNDINSSWEWPLSEVTKIMKLGITNGTCVLSFTNRGLMAITTESNNGQYVYLIPARSN